ncbi:twin-arginine translocase subunit TatC [Ornithinibacillus bavariensis]|uniref:Sec-independent protein translocase protein TatC n=1 Tax=Ornithinibacillus bavariensis TaxID=545502 RepID=A0A919XA29_9BACI|nr:twin-arginine translocase subunit TatC [Ornithinibacillus bavariensis]GIO28639.1 Sec-independent protein translocase protein TatC [Ornithinibacillus bavariensis]
MNHDMTFLEHLTELRRRLLIVAIVFIFSFIFGYVISPTILEFIRDYTFPDNIEWNVFNFTDGFMIYLKCSILVSSFCTIPVFVYELWRFIKPGLTRKEARATFFYIPSSFLLFGIGVSFSFFILFPMVLNFMSSINHNIGATETYGISQYFTLLFNIVFPVSIIFELPVIVMLLSRIGILSPDRLKKARKVSYFILVIIGVSLTPPDFVSDILVIIPLILLFEFSIQISGWSIKRRNKNLLK